MLTLRARGGIRLPRVVPLGDVGSLRAAAPQSIRKPELSGTPTPLGSHPMQARRASNNNWQARHRPAEVAEDSNNEGLLLRLQRSLPRQGPPKGPLRHQNHHQREPESL